MHEGFAGGPVIDAAGRVIGISSGAAIRGLEVAIPAAIAWATAAEILKQGHPARGFLGIAGQAVQLAENRRGGTSQERGLLVVGVTPDSPADAAGVLVGDVLLRFDGHAIHAAEDLLDLLAGDRVGRAVPATLLRGGVPLDITLTVGTRQPS
jgi:S1-C subfamily serine protease